MMWAERLNLAVYVRESLNQSLNNCYNIITNITYITIFQFLIFLDPSEQGLRQKVTAFLPHFNTNSTHCKQT